MATYSLYSNVASATTWSAGEAIIRAGNTVAWFDFGTGITKDGSNLVSQWSDLSGNSNHLLQANGTNKPTWSADGITFDGSDNFMKTAAFTFNQPEMIYMVMKQITWVDTDIILDGNANASMYFSQTGVTPKTGIYAGAWLIEGTGNLIVNTISIVRILYNGVNSLLQINNNAANTGNAGTNNAGGITLGTRGAGDTRFANIMVKEMVARNVADNATIQTAIYNYLAGKHGLTLI